MRIVDKTIEMYVEDSAVVRGKAWDYEKCPVVKYVFTEVNYLNLWQKNRTYKERKECEADYEACIDR